MNKEKVMQSLKRTKEELISFSCLVAKWVKDDLWPWIKTLIKKSIPILKQIWALLVELIVKIARFIAVQIEKMTKKKTIEDKPKDPNNTDKGKN